MSSGKRKRLGVFCITKSAHDHIIHAHRHIHHHFEYVSHHASPFVSLECLYYITSKDICQHFYCIFLNNFSKVYRLCPSGFSVCINVSGGACHCRYLNNAEKHKNRKCKCNNFLFHKISFLFVFQRDLEGKLTL